MADSNRTVLFACADTEIDLLWLSASEAEGCALYVGSGDSFDSPRSAVHLTKASAIQLVADICQVADLTNEDFEEAFHG